MGLPPRRRRRPGAAAERPAAAAALRGGDAAGGRTGRGRCASRGWKGRFGCENDGNMVRNGGKMMVK